MDGVAEIESMVCGTLARATNWDVGALTSRTSLSELAIDSLSLTTLIAQLEATFTIRLSPEQHVAIYEADDIGTIVTVARDALAQMSDA